MVCQDVSAYVFGSWWEGKDSVTNFQGRQINLPTQSVTPKRYVTNFLDKSHYTKCNKSPYTSTYLPMCTYVFIIYVGPQIGMNPKPILGLPDLETNSGSPRSDMGSPF
jgi:hypothetical protein